MDILGMLFGGSWYNVQIMKKKYQHAQLVKKIN